jgi:predicted alpha/beta-hydrolase family hydrolase
MLAASEPGLVEALLLLAYPLHPPERPETLRTAHFPSLETPAMFASGERDGFATREEMETALKMIPARTELMMVSGAGHELMNAKNRAGLPGDVVRAFLRFLAH